MQVRLTHCAMDGVIPRDKLSNNAEWKRGDLRDKLQKDQVRRALGLRAAWGLIPPPVAPLSQRPARFAAVTGKRPIPTQA